MQHADLAAHHLTQLNRLNMEAIRRRLNEDNIFAIYLLNRFLRNEQRGLPSPLLNSEFASISGRNRVSG